MPTTNLKAVVKDEPPDPFEAAAAEVAAAERRLSERKRKLAEVQARRAEVEKEIRAGALEGNVAGLGALSSERAQLADAEMALAAYSIAPLEEEVRVEKERQAAINRERYAARRAEERRKSEAELTALDARISSGLVSVAADLRARVPLLAALGRTDAPRLDAVTAEDGSDLATFRRWLSLRDGKDYTLAEVLLGALRESAAWKSWKREGK